MISGKRNTVHKNQYELEFSLKDYHLCDSLETDRVSAIRMKKESKISSGKKRKKEK